MADGSGVTRLGNIEAGRIQKFFCINDPERSDLPRSGEGSILQKTPKTIHVQGREVKGWIVELLTPSTDGIVRIDPSEDTVATAMDRH